MTTHGGPEFFQRHIPLPAKLVILAKVNDPSETSIMLCDDLPDLEERVARYVTEWAGMFPNSPVKLCRIIDISETGDI